MAERFNRHFATDGAVEITLRAPIPIETPLQVVPTEDALLLNDGETFVCEARAGSVAHLSPPPPPTDWNDVMRRGEVGGAPDDGEFSRCIVCGRERAVGDGLRVLGTAGPQPGYSLSCYVPHPNHADAAGRIRPEFVWGTLDCPGAFAAQDPDDFRPALTGRMTAKVIEPRRKSASAAPWSAGRSARRAASSIPARRSTPSRGASAPSATAPGSCSGSSAGGRRWWRCCRRRRASSWAGAPGSCWLPDPSGEASSRCGIRRAFPRADAPPGR